MGDDKNRVCPVERAGNLDNRFRRWIQNPRKILGPYMREGMTVLDLGCGPGFFLLRSQKWLANLDELLLLICRMECFRK